MIYDLIIVGGGPSGVYAAVHANKNLKVLILERNNELLRKFLQTGGGHCNITNNSSVKELNENMLYSSKFMFSSFSNFGPKQILEFCKNNRIETYQVEETKKIKIVCKNSRFKIKLEDLLNQNQNIEIKYNTLVKNIIKKDELFNVIDENNSIFISKNVIVATGGLSYPKTGSSGFGYKFALNLGHTILKTFPMGLGIVTKDKFNINSNLMGTPFSNVKCSIFNKENNKIIISESGELMITHFGLGGTVIRRISGYVGYHNDLKMILKISFLNKEEILNEINKNKKLYSCFKFLPNKFIEFIYKNIGLSPNQETANLSKKQLNEIIENLSNYTLEIISTNDPLLAISTGGGVNFSELNPKTMESKIHSGLYFIGETLGVSPKTGGFNMTVCFSTALSAITNINNKYVL